MSLVHVNQLLENLIVAQLVKKLFYYFRFHKSPPLVPIPSQMHPVHTLMNIKPFLMLVLLSAEQVRGFY